MKDANHEQTHLEKTRITAAAKKALIAADPHYFAWPSEQQELFRATMKREARRRVKQILLHDLLAIQCSLDQADSVWNEVPLKRLKMLNWASLLTSGIGENFIYLNEPMADGKSLLNFETLYDYDYDDYLFQEKSKRRDFPHYEGADYYAWRHPSWSRLLVDDKFYYANLLSLATHFVNEIEAAGDDLIDQLIPHRYVDGTDNGRPENGGFLWDMKLDAGGNEGQLDELRSRWYDYQQERWLDLSKAFSQSEPAIYVQDKDSDKDPNLSFIFNNADALKMVRWRHFLADCRPIMTELSTLNEQLALEIQRATSWLIKAHRDIMDNFDPTVVKLQKKKKIILSPGALDDLNKIGQDEEQPE